ncbi:MAG: hypothetical protein WD002_14000 [Pseudomonadales bacterium]
MTLKIVKGQSGEGKLIRLEVLETCSGPAGECERLNDCKARWATTALMSPLMIPDTRSIVGLLGTGHSTSNVEEISAWISAQSDLAGATDSELLAALELRFRRAVDHFPEP